MTANTSQDMLAAIFEMQAQLNDYVFQKNGIPGPKGQPLTMSDIADAATIGALSVNQLPNEWLGKYATAMEAELNELRDDLLWKWWSKDQINLQNVRVELVDILHFLISAMIASGLTAFKVHDLYQQKHAVNLTRQDTGYSKHTKTEDDNRGIS